VHRGSELGKWEGDQKPGHNKRQLAACQATWDKEGEETEGGGVRERLTQKEQIRDK